MASLWTITFGKYEFTIDRKARTYSLRETKTGTVWATGFSLGWVDLKHRETGTITRYSFGEMSTFSLSEKSGVQGKRILFGLECCGVPLDLYLICAEAEIQIVVESNRDSRTHTVEGFGLLPGLCHAPDSAGAYLVFPIGEGMIASTSEVPDSFWLPTWEAADGLTMPFCGAVRRADNTTSLLTLITDSAYSGLRGVPSERGVSVSWEYGRDPERRRIDLRILLNTEENYIQVARNYREKIIRDRNHIPLRRKAQERPVLASFLGIHTEPTPFLPLNDLDGVTATLVDKSANRWEQMEAQLETILASREETTLVGDSGVCDWACMALEFVREFTPLPRFGRRVPLFSVVYHDALIPLFMVQDRHSANRLLLRLGYPGTDSLASALPVNVAELYRATFSAFLVAHRFLSEDGMVGGGLL